MTGLSRPKGMSMTLLKRIRCVSCPILPSRRMPCHVPLPLPLMDGHTSSSPLRNFAASALKASEEWDTTGWRPTATMLALKPLMESQWPIGPRLANISTTTTLQLTRSYPSDSLNSRMASQSLGTSTSTPTTLARLTLTNSSLSAATCAAESAINCWKKTTLKICRQNDPIHQDPSLFREGRYHYS